MPRPRPVRRAPGVDVLVHSRPLVCRMPSSIPWSPRQRRRCSGWAGTRSQVRQRRGTAIAAPRIAVRRACARRHHPSAASPRSRIMEAGMASAIPCPISESARIRGAVRESPRCSRSTAAMLAGNTTFPPDLTATARRAGARRAPLAGAQLREGMISSSAVPFGSCPAEAAGEVAPGTTVSGVVVPGAVALETGGFGAAARTGAGAGEATLGEAGEVPSRSDGGRTESLARVRAVLVAPLETAGARWSAELSRGGGAVATTCCAGWSRRNAPS